MTAPIYKVGDLVMAQKDYDYNSPNYEWWPVGNNYPSDYAIITKIQNVTPIRDVYWVKFVDGSEDCVNLSEIRMVAKGVKFPATNAASPLNII